MAFGDVFVLVRVPPQPQGSGHTHEEYTRLVKAKLNDQLEKNGMTSARTSWMGRSDTPEVPAQNPAYVKGLLGGTRVDPAHVDLISPTTDDIEYCIVSTSELYCYGGLKPVWTDTTTADPFAIPVPLGNGVEVIVKLEFVVRWLQALENSAAVTIPSRGTIAMPSGGEEE